MDREARVPMDMRFRNKMSEMIYGKPKTDEKQADAETKKKENQ